MPADERWHFLVSWQNSYWYSLPVIQRIKYLFIGRAVAAACLAIKLKNQIRHGSPVHLHALDVLCIIDAYFPLCVKVASRLSPYCSTAPCRNSNVCWTS